MGFAAHDLMLAIIHHLLVFSLAGILVYEFATIRESMTVADVRRVARVDLWYGILAGAILVVGFARAVFAAKGWDYYAGNAFFWAKIATFGAVGLLSIPPTMTVIAWRRALANNPTARPPREAVRNVRRLLRAQMVLFALIPTLAAIMARGSELPAG